MFFVKYGNEYIHDPRKDLFLTAANPEVELNASGSFTFTMQYNNPLYDKLVERDTKNPITVWQDDELIFIGDIINIESGFKKYKEVECRGILGWLNDTIVRPYSTLESENDNVAPDGIAGYFEWLINNHNSQVEDTKKFKIDKNEGQSLDSKIYRSDSSYTNTGELIKSKILDEVGGYIIPREENGEHVIDLIREIPEDNSQLIDFGKNLLDYVSSEDTDGMYTFVIPTGVMAEKESDNSEKATHNITIGERTITDLTRAMENRKAEYEEAQNNSSTTEEDLKAAKEAYESANAALEDAKVYTLDREVEEGYFKQGDIIYSEAAVKEYGWIGCPVAFDNTTLVSELIRNGVLALKGMESPVRTIEVKAVDLSMIKPNYSPIRVGQYVRVRSKPHNFDSYMLCSKISYDLNQPDQNTFTLGQTYDVLTGIQNKKIKALNESVNHVYSSAERISDEAKAIADATKKNEEEINNVREALLNIDGLYMHLRYSANADGSDMTEYPELNTIYIGIYSGNQKEAPTEKEMYTWSRFKGEEGQSVKGDDGANAYLHIKYSNDGETFTSNNGETPGYWMGTYTDHNETDSMIFDDYSWAKIKGEKGDTGPQGLQGIQGEKGEQGVPGTPGDSGKTTYFHIKYSAYSKPTANQMSELPNTYIGTYVDFTKEDSTNPDDYTWFRIKGEDGIPGIGVDGKTSYLHIKYSNDGSTFTANNGETPGEWIGTYTDHTEADSTNFRDYTWTKIKGEKGDQGIQGLQGPKGDQGVKGDPGQNGVSTYFHIAYANSADGKTDFSVSDPSGRDYIGTYVDSNPTDSTNYASYSWQLVKGSQGPKGDQGIAGTKGADGKTTYLHIAYATSADGSTGFSVSDSANKTYIGQYTDYTESDSTDPTKYKWTLIKGATGATGPQGPKGEKGKDGVSITSVDVYYAQSTSSSTAPTSGWQTTAPSWVNGKYIWTKTLTILSSGIIKESTPVCITGQIGATGSTGRGIYSITEEYYLSTSKTSQTGGSWSTTPPTWSSGKYVWTRSKIVYTNPSGTEYTTPICDSSWEAVNEVKVGGRNYVWNTATSMGTIGINSTNQQHPSMESLYRLTRKFSQMGLKVGDSVTISFDWEVTNSDSPSGRFAVGVNANPWEFFGGETFSSTNKKGHFVKTYTVDQTLLDSTATSIRFRFDNFTTNAKFIVSKLKLETGDKATDWVVAPEDTDYKLNKTQSYQIYGANGTVKWVHLGTLTSSGDSSVAVITIQTGNGYNSSSSQNSNVVITIKDGWQSTPSATNSFGVSVLRENCEDLKVKVIPITHNICDVWVHFPWDYWNGNYKVDGLYSSWNHSCAYQDSEPSGTAANIEYRMNSENASKTATNYMNFIEGKGLIVGDQRGSTLGNNVLIDSDSVDIRSGDTVLASFYAGTDSSGKAISKIHTPGNSEFGSYKNYGTEKYGRATMTNSTYVNTSSNGYENNNAYTIISSLSYDGNASVGLKAARIDLSSQISTKDDYSVANSSIMEDADDIILNGVNNVILRSNFLNLEGNNYIVQNADKFRSAISAAASNHTHSADDITSGTLPVARGGTGSTATTSSTTLSNFMTINTNAVTEGTGYIAKWGKMIQFYMNLKLKNALSAGDINNILLGTFKDAYKPKIYTACSTGDTGEIASFVLDTNGELRVCATHTKFSAGYRISVGGTYLLP